METESQKTGVCAVRANGLCCPNFVTKFFNVCACKWLGTRLKVGDMVTIGCVNGIIRFTHNDNLILTRKVPNGFCGMGIFDDSSGNYIYKGYIFEILSEQDLCWPHSLWCNNEKGIDIQRFDDFCCLNKNDFYNEGLLRALYNGLAHWLPHGMYNVKSRSSVTWSCLLNDGSNASVILSEKTLRDGRLLYIARDKDDYHFESLILERAMDIELWEGVRWKNEVLVNIGLLRHAEFLMKQKTLRITERFKDAIKKGAIPDWYLFFEKPSLEPEGKIEKMNGKGSPWNLEHKRELKASAYKEIALAGQENRSPDWKNVKVESRGSIEAKTIQEKVTEFANLEKPKGDFWAIRNAFKKKRGRPTL